MDKPHLVLSEEGKTKLRRTNSVLTIRITLKELEVAIADNVNYAMRDGYVSWPRRDHLTDEDSNDIDTDLMWGIVGELCVRKRFFTEESWNAFLEYYKTHKWEG